MWWMFPLRLLSMLWRLWFYTSVLLAIVLLFPFIFTTAQRPEHYPRFFFWARVWARLVLIFSGFAVSATWHERPDKDKVYIIVANHTSMVDILMTLVLFPNCFVFIGKRELAQLPVFGYFYKKTNLLVDRRSLRSRREVQEKAGKILERGRGLCIFPEGGVPEVEVLMAPFKNGAFTLAVKHGVPLIPVSYLDNKRHFPFHWWRGYPGRLRAIIHPFLLPQMDQKGEAERLKRTCFKTILQPLPRPGTTDFNTKT